MLTFYMSHAKLRSQWNITRRSTLKEDHPEKTNQKPRHSQFNRDHLERITYQQIPKAYTKHNKLTIQQYIASTQHVHGKRHILSLKSKFLET